MDHQPNSEWIWPTPTPTKRKAEYYDSWEERAFAEDAAGVLGSSGCVWPPRSYTCTFCRREFRSAQALGGHMNVHRRDRARLKQLPNTPQSPPDTTLSKPYVNYKKCPSEGFATLVYGTNPNPNISNTLLQSFGPNLRPNYAKAKILEGVNSKRLNSELSICLNLVVRSNIDGDDQQEAKRRKIVGTSREPSPPLIFDVNRKSKINSNCSTSSREIDLELRL